MKDQLTEEQTEAILQALEEAIATGPWDESAFLRVIGKNLREIRDNFISRLGNPQALEKSRAELLAANRFAQRTDMKEIFIALYSSDGSNLQAWERILANLPGQTISRPIYAEEEDIKYLIKSKENKVNEAYVGIYINNNDILALSPDKIPVDKFGKALISLKDKTLNLDNISRFVHLSGVYHYAKGRLLKIS